MARTSYQKGTVEFHNGQWSVRYRERNHFTGRWTQRREYLSGARNQNDARIRADHFMIGVNQRNNDPRAARRVNTFNDFTQTLWQSYLGGRELSPATVASYDSMLRRHIAPFFGPMRLRNVLPSDVTKFFDNLRGKVTNKYLSNLYALLSVMFELARQYDEIDANPVRSKLHKPQAEAREKPILTLDETAAVIAGVPEEHRALVVVLAVTGLRCGELLGLQWQAVDWQAGRLSVTKAVWRGRMKDPKTAASRRELTLPGPVVEMLARRREAAKYAGPEDLIFCRDDASPLDPGYVRKSVLYPAMDAAGITRTARAYGFHVFRHSLGSHLHDLTPNLKLIQAQLGHSRVETTGNIYLHRTENSAEQAAESIRDLAALILPDEGAPVVH
jgi:integrase